MESTGPLTRSRMKSGVAAPSAAPSTRKKAATTRSARKPAGQAKDLATAEPDDTSTQADVAESSTVAQQQDSTSAADSADCNVPATVAAVPGPLAGLTPLPANSASPGDHPGPTPGTVGASPMMPIKLDSLWTPAVPGINDEQHRSANGRPSSAADSLSGRVPCSTPSAGGVDLAAMFISTPAPAAVAQAAASPVEGLVASGVEQQQQDDELVEQPFGGFVGAVAGAEDDDGDDVQMQEETAGMIDTFCFGSPAAVAAVEAATVTELDDASEPSAPLLPISPAVLPAVSPARSRRTTPRRAAAVSSPAPSPGVAAGAERSPAPAAAGAGSPLPGSPFPEDDGDLPPAEDEYPEELALLQEVMAEDLLLQSSAAPAAPSAAFVAEAAGSEDGMAVDSYPDQEQNAQRQAGASAGADMEAEQECSEEQLDFGESEELPATEDGEGDLAELAALEAVMDAEVAAAEAAQQQMQEQSSADEPPAAAEVAQEATAMQGCESPAPTAESASARPTPAMVKPATPAAAAVAAADLPVMSPEAGVLPAVASPSRTAGGTITTTAPPKSALAKPREGSADASARKSAHVVVPGPSPKSSAKAGSSSRKGADDGSSPGHTPYPSKAKVKAATAAADRTCSLVGAAGSKPGAAASASSSISHKKEVGYARAHSALKHYASNLATAEQQQASSTSGSFPKQAAAASPGFGSRLLQPTASYIAKTKAAAAADADPLVWSPPLTPEASGAGASQGGSGAGAAGAAAGRPRLASKVVVPSPAAGKAGGQPSMAALKRSIKEKMAAKAHATLTELSSNADKVHDVNAPRGGRPKAAKAKAPPAAEPELDFDDEEDYDEEYEAYGDQHAAGELAHSLAGLRMGLPAGPLRGVAGPSGKHLVFDEEGEPAETPCSKLRQAPRHTYFDEEGRPTQAAPARPVWR